MIKPLVKILELVTFFLCKTQEASMVIDFSSSKMHEPWRLIDQDEDTEKTGEYNIGIEEEN